MTKQELTKAIRCNLFAKRDNLDEAFSYFYEVINRMDSKDKAAATTAMAVVLNTLADQMESLK